MAIVPSSFSYAFPDLNIVSSGAQEGWNTYTPSSGQVFRSDAASVININVADPGLFHRFRRGYLKGTIVAHAADGTVIADPSTRLTSLGLASCIQRLVVQVGAQTAVNCDTYPNLLSLVYNNAPVTRKKILTYMEGYQTGGVLNSLPSGKATFCHALQGTLFSSGAEFPTPLVQNGVTIQIYLAAANRVFTTPNVAYYTLENVSYNCQTVRPNPDVLLRLMSALDRGVSLYIPMVEIESFMNYGSGGTQQQFNLAVGSKKSIQSFAMMFRKESDLADPTKDKNAISSSMGLTDYTIQVAGTVTPMIRAWSYNPSGANFDPEVMAVALASADTMYTADQSIDFDLANFDSKFFSLRYNWKSSDETFGDGISTEVGSGTLTITTNHNAPVGSDVRVSTFVFVDCVLEIRKDIIRVNYTW